MYHFSFVILHYMSLQDTIECVRSIQNNISYSNYSIIVVDNKSPNDSGILLKKRYANNRAIHFISSDRNLGFAKGNNLGFQYAKYELKSNFIALINNDTYIEQKDFIQRIIRRWEFSKFHILGPDIINPAEHKHQNPQPAYLTSKKDLRKTIALNSFFMVLNCLGIEPIWARLTNWKKHIFSHPVLSVMGPREIIDNKVEKKDVKLHGACLVFSPDYIEKYNGLYPETFLYMEEDILFYFAQNNGLITLYFPEVVIFHKDDRSLNMVYKKNRQRRKFYYLNHIKSAYIFLHLMNTKDVRI